MRLTAVSIGMTRATVVLMCDGPCACLEMPCRASTLPAHQHALWMRGCAQVGGPRGRRTIALPW